MAKGDPSSIYIPEEFVGELDDEKFRALLNWILREHERISHAFESAPVTFVDEYHVEPSKPRQGYLVIADGTDWDPGFGAGTYCFINGAWQPMFTTSFGAVTSIDVAGTDGIGSTGGPVTSAGVITLSLGNITPDSVAAVGTVTGSNLSGTNTGDQTIILTGDVTGTGTGSFSTTLVATTGVVEIIQDSIGAILVDSGRIDFTYNDGTPSITADLVASSVTEGYLSLSNVTTWDVDTTRHGFIPTLPNDATKFFNGVGSWVTPAAVNSFETIAVAGQSNVVADSSTDTLTFTAGSNITITTNPTGDAIRIDATSASGSTTLVDLGLTLALINNRVTY